MTDYFNYKRRKSSEVAVGNTPLGGDNPIRVQSMANVSTMDTEAAVAQAIRLVGVGSEYIRFTAQGEREANNLGVISDLLRKAGFSTPLVADIHFNPRAADVAATKVEKVRINPGNYVDKVKTFNMVDYTDEEYAAELDKIRKRFTPFLKLCKENNTAIRIGVNHGSLSDRIMSRYGDTPEGMVASCMEFLRICRDEDFQNVVISIKASNTVIMVKTVRLLVDTMDKENMHYPLHLGVTEAGDSEDGRIKSAVGIGTLLADGIGDTIRVSLSEEPEAEIPVARKLVDYVNERKNHSHINGKIATSFDFLAMNHKPSKGIKNIGGDSLPIIISDRSRGNFEFDHLSMPDYVYIGKESSDNLPDTMKVLVDAHFWKAAPNAFPLFIASEIGELDKYGTDLKFIRLNYTDLTDENLEQLHTHQEVVILLDTHHPNGLGEQRAALQKLNEKGTANPVIILREYNHDDEESMMIKSGADIGALLLDGFGDGIMIANEQAEPQAIDRCMLGILQATRRRISKTEYISCPGCGRTLYNLQSTIARIKKATSHLKGLKIGIMGCIVNGPGEMADADYGYVGAGKKCINLYKGKICVKKNIPEEEAVDSLIKLIKENGDWVD